MTEEKKYTFVFVEDDLSQVKMFIDIFGDFPFLDQFAFIILKDLSEVKARYETGENLPAEIVYQDGNLSPVGGTQYPAQEGVESLAMIKANNPDHFVIWTSSVPWEDLNPELKADNQVLPDAEINKGSIISSLQNGRFEKAINAFLGRVQ